MDLVFTRVVAGLYTGIQKGSVYVHHGRIARVFLFCNWHLDGYSLTVQPKTCVVDFAFTTIHNAHFIFYALPMLGLLSGSFGKLHLAEHGRRGTLGKWVSIIEEKS